MKMRQDTHLQRLDGAGQPVVYRDRRPLTSRAARSVVSTTLRTFAFLGRLVDDTVALAAPGYALRRHMHRQLYHQARGFDAADPSRLNAHRIARVRDADSEINSKNLKLRAFSRDLVRNSPTARNLKRTSTANVVGDADAGQGVVIKAAVLQLDGDGLDEDVNAKLNAKWEEVRDRLDYVGRWGFADLCRLAHNELVEAGEVLAIKHTRPGPDSKFPLSYEMIEPDRLPTNNERFLATHPTGRFMLDDGKGSPVLDENGNPVEHYIKHGIEYNQFHQITGYHILAEHPGNELQLGATYQTVRYDARRVIHYFDPDRAEQTRGMSRFVAILNTLADLKDLVEWELIAAKAQACFGIHFTGTVGGTANPASGNGSGSVTDAYGNPVTELQPGMVTSGATEGKFYQSTRPGNTFLPFVQSLQRFAGAGFGNGYSATSKDYSQGAYSALRQEDNEDERAYRLDQGLHERHLARRVWRDFVEVCAATGVIDASAYRENPARFLRTMVRFPGRKHINPQQEVMAEVIALANGLKDLDECASASGKSPEDRLKKQAEVKALGERLGLTLGWAYGVSTTPANGGGAAPAEAAKDAEEIEDETESDLTNGRAAKKGALAHA